MTHAATGRILEHPFRMFDHFRRIHEGAKCQLLRVVTCVIPDGRRDGSRKREVVCNGEESCV